jgi:predicted Zn-dependent protease
VELGFLEALRKRVPSYEPVLEALGHIYTRVGCIEDGLQVDLELTRLRPEQPVNWYNLACSYALLGHVDEAVHALTEAVKRGYDDAEWLSKDKDLQALREDPRFLKLLRRLTTERRT